MWSKKLPQGHLNAIWHSIQMIFKLSLNLVWTTSKWTILQETKHIEPITPIKSSLIKANQGGAHNYNLKLRESLPFTAWLNDTIYHLNECVVPLHYKTITNDVNPRPDEMCRNYVLVNLNWPRGAGGVGIGSGIIAHRCSNLSGKWCHEQGEPIAKLVTDEPVEFRK